MIKNYIKFALRNIIRHKGYSAVNILGLSVGLACVILISMIIWNETSFDNFHEKKDRIYRVYIQEKRADNSIETAPVMIPFAPAAQAEIPEIEYAVRISNHGILAAYNDKKFYERAVYVDDKFFNVFSFPFILGNSRNALEKPLTVVLTEKMATKYFGDEDPIGKSLLFDNKDNYLVTGVIKNLPFNSHLQGDIFASFSSLNKMNFSRYDKWGSFGNDFTYLLIKEQTDPSAVEKKLNNVIVSNADESYHDRYNMKMQKLSDIHFSNLIHDDAKTTPILFLYIFAAIGIFILLIASINFINLTTARSSKRNKEVGIRKVAGANRFNLIIQFLIEAFILTIVSAAIAVLLADLLIPQVNNVLSQNLSISILFDSTFFILFASILIITSLMAGTYPAFVLSKPMPGKILKNNSSPKSRFNLRSALVTTQFAISVFLIIGTFIVFNQIDFMLSKDLGFPKDKIVVLNNSNPKIREDGLAFKQSLLNNNYFKSASYSSGTPGSNSSATSNFFPEGGGEESEIILQIIDVDYDFLNTFDLTMKKGRFFSKEFTTDTSEAYIINETAANKLGWQDPVGNRLAIGSPDPDADFKNVIGVMPDFNYRSLQDEIAPTIFRLRPNGARFLSLRLASEDATSALDFARETNASFSPAYPFYFFFIEERFENYNRTGVAVGKLLGFFSVLAILLSCIGILGLISFSTEQKSKEIGVRKVLGASVSSIVYMLCREFIKWVLIANIVVWPIAYFAANKFLSNFAYQSEINYLIFGIILFLSVLITLLTVGFHTIKAATANPVKSLRYE